VKVGTEVKVVGNLSALELLTTLIMVVTLPSLAQSLDGRVADPMSSGKMS